MCIEDICGICREELMSNVRVLECKHVFHESCINDWINRCATCPFCRSIIINDNENTEYERLLSDPSVRLIEIYRRARELNLSEETITDLETILGLEIPDTELENDYSIGDFL